MRHPAGAGGLPAGVVAGRGLARPGVGGRGAGEGRVLFRIGEVMEVFEDGNRKEIRCTRCRHVYGLAEEDPRQGALLREGPVASVNPINRHSPLADIVLRQFICPGCGTLISTDIARRGEPILPETRLDLTR